jgi:hypothetical protein
MKQWDNDGSLGMPAASKVVKKVWKLRIARDRGKLLATDNMKAKQQSDRAFGFTFGGLFFLITTVGWVFFDRLPYWALVTAIVFTLLALAVPSVLMPLNQLWRWIGPKIAAINNAIILGAVFYLFVTPVGLIMRLFGRDPLHRSINEKVATYWTTVQRPADSESFSDQF